MNKIGGKIVLWGLILAMLAFTAIRTLHFLQMTFPPEQAYVSYLGLAAFDIGVLGWFYYATQSAEGAAQRAIAYGLIFVCLAGVIATTVADMVIVSSENGLTKLPSQWGTIGLWAVILVIVVNVAAGIVVHLADPKHQKHLAQEGAKDKIHSAVMVHITQQAETIAPMIAQAVARHWADQTIAEMTGMIPGNVARQALPPPMSNQVTGTLQAVQMPQTAPMPVLPAQPHPQQTEQNNSEYVPAGPGAIQQMASLLKASLGVFNPDKQPAPSEHFTEPLLTVQANQQSDQ